MVYRGYPRKGQRGQRDWLICLCLCGCLFGGIGCGLRIVTITLSQKTSLERQLMGEQEPLTEEEILAASVRASKRTTVGPLDRMRQKAIAARRRQLFNRDDVDELKQLGCLGEGLEGKILARPCSPPATTGRAKAEIRRLFSEENEDRRAILDWVVAADPVLTRADRPQVTNLYVTLVREQLVAGQWYQAQDGSWSQK